MQLALSTYGAATGVEEVGVGEGNFSRITGKPQAKSFEGLPWAAATIR